AWSKIKMQIPPGDLNVIVTAKQFNWQVTYAGPDGKFGTADDKTFLDEMHVPVGKKIHVTLKSQDVIHSFFVPQFRIKQDAVPGRRGVRPRRGATCSSPQVRSGRAPSSGASAPRAWGAGSSLTRPRTTPSGRRKPSRPKARRPPSPRRRRNPNHERHRGHRAR